MKKYKTEAQRAEEELSQYFGHENRVYKPWQLADHMIEPVRIDGTVDDVLLLASANVYVRPEFSIDDQSVQIPNLFCKLNGDIEGIHLDMLALAREHGELVEVYKTFDKMAKPPNKTPLKRQPPWFDKQRGIDVEAALAARIPNLQIMRPAYQKNYLIAINRVIALVKSDGYIGNKPTERDILEVLLYNSNKIIRMYHHFDYQYVNPKFVVNDKKGVTISTYAVVRLLMMHTLGFDVFVLSENGYASIENYLDDSVCRSYQVTPSERKHSMSLVKRSRTQRTVVLGAAAVVTLALLFGILRLAIGF